MPYFFKIADYFSNTEKWLDAIKFAIGDFSQGCNEKQKGNIMIIIIKLKDSEIRRHKHNFEYITENDVEPSKRVGKFKIMFIHEEIDDEEIFNKKMLYFEEQLKFLSSPESKYSIDIDNLYIHITCKSNYESIKKKGLLHTVNDKNKIGNRGGKSKKRKHTIHKKNKSKKRKSLQ